MKKRILSVLLVVAMLASMIVLPVYANSTTAQSATSNACPCGCGRDLDEIPDSEWIDISDTTAANITTYEMKSSGHYRIASDGLYGSGNVVQIATALADANEDKFVFDLNGKKLTATSRAFWLNGSYSAKTAKDHLYIVDTVGGATVTTNSTSDAMSGTLVYTKGIDVSIYGGTWTTKYTGTDDLSAKGRAFQARLDGININIYGGTIDFSQDGNSTAGFASSNTTQTNFNIYGGTIIGGQSTVGDFYLLGGSEVNISGGDVQCWINGVSGTSVSVSGTPVVKNIDLTTIGTVDVGTLTGSASIRVTKAVDTAFTQELDAAAAELYTEYFRSAANNYGKAYVTDSGALALATPICPHCEKKWSDITWDNWEDLRDWTSSDSYGSGKQLETSGHYKLTDDFTAGGSLWIGVASATGDAVTDVVIDMQGHTYDATAKNYRCFYLRSGNSLTVLDSVGEGELKGRYVHATIGGGALYLDGNAKFYDVKITDTATSTRAVQGGAIKAGSNTVHMERCTITGQSANIGGAYYMTSGKLTAVDCKFVGGTASTSAGTFYLSTGNANLTRCELVGGTAPYGGTVQVTSGTLTLNDCNVYSGTSTDTKYLSHGIHVSGAGKLNINNGYVEDVYAMSADFKPVLTGKVTVDNMVFTDAGVAMDISGMDKENSSVTVDAPIGSFTAALTNNDAAQAFLDAEAITSGTDLEIQVEDAKLVMVAAAYIAHCHDCGQEVEWEPLVLTVIESNTDSDAALEKYLYFDPTGTTSHYYMTEDIARTDSTMIRIGYRVDDVNGTGTIVKLQGEDVHIELNGHTYTNTGRGFYIYQGNKLHIQDTSVEGTGSVIARGANDQGGAVFYVEGAKTHKGESETIIDIPGAILSVYGGTYTLDAGRTLGVGGVVSANGYTKVTAENATFDGSAFDFEAINGGTVYFASNSQGTLTDCTVIGGKAQYGGAMYIVGADVTLDGETVVKDGYAYERAGNIYVTNSGAELILTDDVQVIDGYAVGNGGNFYVTSTAILNISGNAMISGGDACNGGNAYFPSGGILQMSGGTVKDGVAYNDGVTETYGRGGNLYLGGAAHTISGGTVTGGVSEADDPTSPLGGGNIHVHEEGGILTISGGAVISDGSSGSNGGNIFARGDLVLEDAVISGGEATYSGADIYVYSTGSLSISDAVTGSLGMGFHDELFEGATPYGSKVLNTAATTLNAALTLDGVRGNVTMYEQDGALWVQDGGVAIEDLEGNFEYFADPATAVTAFNDETDAWLVICGADELVLGVGSYGVDVNGCTVNISGVEGSDVTCVDSANEDYKTYGLVTLDENVQLNNDIQINADGHDFFTVEENDQYSFHILDMEITAVSLKTSSGGLYYYAKYNCDSKLAEYVDTFGIVTQLWEMPTEITDQSSEIRGEDFVANKEITGLTMNGIIGNNDLTDLKTGAILTNDERGEITIYAAPYVMLTTGGVKIATEEVGMSFYDCCDAIDDMIGDLLAADAADATADKYIKYMTNLFTKVWADMGLTWEFDYFPTAAEKPEA